jgi:hypothetical protein
VRRALPIVVVVVVALVAGNVEALDLRLSSQNDLVSRNPTSDDLYTFSFALDLARDPYRFSLREDAFTDREAGLRFDETYYLVGRSVPGTRSWSVDVQAGIVHVGRGLLGEDVQNSVHRLVGAEQLTLAYQPSSVHPSAGLDAERTLRPHRNVRLGPRIEARTSPSLESHLVLAGQTEWHAGRRVAVEVLAGARLTHASLEPLEPRLDPVAPVARVGIVFQDAFFVSWSYNDHGDRREHVGLGFRTGLGTGRAESAR